jgi:hypothetical protein
MFASLLLGVLGAHAALDMLPDDGTCLPGETIQVFAPEPDTGAGWTCAWGADEIFGELPDGGYAEIVCPGCGRRVQDQVYALYAVCTDVDGDAQWEFDDIVVRCSEVEGEPEGCACGGEGSLSWAWVLMVPAALRRWRGAWSNVGAQYSMAATSRG